VKDSRPALVVLIIAIAAVGLYYQQKDAARQRAASPDTTASPATFPDADRDGHPDQLPVRRLAANPDARPALDAIAAAGGYTAWAAHPVLSSVIEEVYLDDRGAIREQRQSRITFTTTGPPRFVLESADGRTKIGIGTSGPWARRKGDNGLWAPLDAPGDPPVAELNRLALRTIWLNRLPFALGDVEASFAPAAHTDPADSLIRVILLRPPAPGDTAARQAALGFEPGTARLRECTFDAGPSPRTIRFDDFHADPTLPLVRPHRWSVFDADPLEGALRRVLEVRLGDFGRDEPVLPERFEPPTN
jgi:hypothetical protein